MKNWSVFGLLIVLAGIVGLGVSRSTGRDGPAVSPGMEVYIGEGCIHCHSQYRRPLEADMSLWGPHSDHRAVLQEGQPVLFGNRRQGPDLSNIGLRRSREWNQIHLMDPRLLRPGSRMPSYADLFENDGKSGEALLDYLETLGMSQMQDWQQFRASWEPDALHKGNIQSGRRLFMENCAACHGRAGRGDGPASGRFSIKPRDLTERQTWRWVQEYDEEMELFLARLIKFGQSGSSMPGTEWLSSQDISDLIRFLDSINGNQKR